MLLLNWQAEYTLEFIPFIIVWIFHFEFVVKRKWLDFTSVFFFWYFLNPETFFKDIIECFLNKKLKVNICYFMVLKHDKHNSV